MKIFLLPLCIVQLAQSLPALSETNVTTFTEPSFASQASQLIALNLLKANGPFDNNNAHSPLGIATVLAILAEGSSNNTYEEFVNVLEFPSNRKYLWESFNRILSIYKSTDYTVNPSFQTWLYIYRNYTAREEFKDIIKTKYHVIIKEINRNNVSNEVEEMTTTQNEGEILAFETQTELNIDTNEEKRNDTYGIEVLDKEASKFDRDIDDKQYVETLKIKEDIIANGEKFIQKSETGESTLSPHFQDLKSFESLKIVERNSKSEKGEDDVNVLENETVLFEEKLNAVRKNHVNEEDVYDHHVASNAPQKVTLPLRKLEDSVAAVGFGGVDLMMALQSHFISLRKLFGGRSLFRKDDIGSALSANSISGKKSEPKEKMLLFNGLYFRGNWAYPFHTIGGSEENVFFVAENVPKPVTMMQSRGMHNVGELQNLDAKAVSIPYENLRYTLVVIVPNKINGLRTLIDNLDITELKVVLNQLQSKDILITLPKFAVEETSNSESVLKKLGLQKIFSTETENFSYLTDDSDVHVNGIVQFVSVRLDEGGSSENSLTAANSEGRTAATTITDEPLQSITVNRPFLYFIMDTIENFVIISGKITAPEIKEEVPVNLDVEVEFEDV